MMIQETRRSNRVVTASDGVHWVILKTSRIGLFRLCLVPVHQRASEDGYGIENIPGKASAGKDRPVPFVPQFSEEIVSARQLHRASKRILRQYLRHVKNLAEAQRASDEIDAILQIGT